MVRMARASTTRNSCRTGCLRARQGLHGAVRRILARRAGGRASTAACCCPDAAIESASDSPTTRITCRPFPMLRGCASSRCGAASQPLRAARVEVARSTPQAAIAELLLEGERRVSGRLLPRRDGRRGAAGQCAGRGARELARRHSPADRVLSAHPAPVSPVPIYSEIRAHARGWVALAASQVCIHVQQAYCSDLPPRPADLARPPPTSRCRVWWFASGIRGADCAPGKELRGAWARRPACSIRCTSRRSARGAGGPGAPAAAVPGADADFSVERDEYNKNVRSAFERMRDFQSAHYRTEPVRRLAVLGAGARRGSLSAELAHKIGRLSRAAKPWTTKTRRSPSTTGRRCSSATA